MQLIHSNIPTVKRVSSPKRDVSQKERSLKWMTIQNRKDYEKALKDNAESLKFIHQYEPGWMPGMEL